MKLLSNLSLIMASLSAGLHLGVLGLTQYMHSTMPTEIARPQHDLSICNVAVVIEPSVLNNHTVRYAKQMMDKKILPYKIDINHKSIVNKKMRYNRSTIKDNADIAGKPNLVSPVSHHANQGIICIHKSEPIYPHEARQFHYQGVVLIRLTILANGHINGIEILKSSGHACLDHSASVAIKQWSFKPAYNNGRPVTAQIDIPIEYSLS